MFENSFEVHYEFFSRHYKNYRKSVVAIRVPKLTIVFIYLDTICSASYKFETEKHGPRNVIDYLIVHLYKCTDEILPYTTSVRVVKSVE